MVTKNEMVAILAALSTDFDKIEEAEAREEQEARNDAYIEPNDVYYERRQQAG